MPLRRALTLRDFADSLSTLPAEVLGQELGWIAKTLGAPVNVTLPALTTTRLRYEEELRQGRVFAVRRSLTAAAAQFPWAAIISDSNLVRRLVVWRIRASSSGAGNFVLADHVILGGTVAQGRQLGPVVKGGAGNEVLSHASTETQSLAALPATFSTYLDGRKSSGPTDEAIFEGPGGAPLAILDPRVSGLGSSLGVAHSLAASTLDCTFLWSEETVA